MGRSRMAWFDSIRDLSGTMVIGLVSVYHHLHNDTRVPGFC